MLPFTVEIRPGKPMFEQVCHAARRAIVGGILKPGEPFPSVRQLSAELRINPNTAHKIVTQLSHEGLLAATPAVGTRVAAPQRDNNPRERAELLGSELEWLVVEARKLGVSLGELREALARHWHKLDPPASTPST